MTWRWASAVHAAGVVAAALLAHSTAHAMPSARFVYLRGKGTDTCPAETEVRAAVQSRLGYDPFSSYAASTMFAEVTAVGSGFSANLKLLDAANVVRGDRVLQVHGRCAELMEAMALTISIAIDPMSVTRNGPPEDAPPAEKPVDTTLPPAPDRPPDPDETPQPAFAKPEALLLSAGLGPLVSLGSSPALAFGGALFLNARLGRLVAGIEGRGDLPASASVADRGRVESSLLAGSVVLGAREGAIFACAVGSLGRLSATSSDVAEARERHAPYLAAGLRVGIALPISERFELVGRLDALANVLRHTIELSGRSAYEYPAATGSASVGIAARIW